MTFNVALKKSSEPPLREARGAKVVAHDIYTNSPLHPMPAQPGKGIQPAEEVSHFLQFRDKQDGFTEVNLEGSEILAREIPRAGFLLSGKPAPSAPLISFQSGHLPFAAGLSRRLSSGFVGPFTSDMYITAADLNDLSAVAGPSLATVQSDVLDGALVFALSPPCGNFMRPCDEGELNNLLKSLRGNSGQPIFLWAASVADRRDPANPVLVLERRIEAFSSLPAILLRGNGCRMKIFGGALDARLALRFHGAAFREGTKVDADSYDDDAGSSSDSLLWEWDDTRIVAGRALDIALEDDSGHPDDDDSFRVACLAVASSVITNLFPAPPSSVVSWAHEQLGGKDRRENVIRALNSDDLRCCAGPKSEIVLEKDGSLSDVLKAHGITSSENQWKFSEWFVVQEEQLFSTDRNNTSQDVRKEFEVRLIEASPAAIMEGREVVRNSENEMISSTDSWTVKVGKQSRASEVSLVLDKHWMRAISGSALGPPAVRETFNIMHDLYPSTSLQSSNRIRNMRQAVALISWLLKGTCTTAISITNFFE